MEFFDTHCHLGLIVEDAVERFMVTQEAQRAGVLGILSITNNLADFQDVYASLHTARNVYFAAGISPSEVTHPGERWEQRLYEVLQLERVLALGEIGLDYFRKFGSREQQMQLFVQQLELAKQLEKPVVIHNRDASKDIAEILREHFPPKGAVLHCYSDTLPTAQKFLEHHENLYFSFSGNITYKTAKKLHDVIRELPLERLLVETESPFMVPEQRRGKRNKPANLIFAVEQVCALRTESPEEVQQALFDNACRLFQVSPSLPSR